jgi:hypothetical protein
MSSSVLNSSTHSIPPTCVRDAAPSSVLSTSVLMMEIKTEELMGVDALKEDGSAYCKRLASAASVGLDNGNNLARLGSTTSMDRLTSAVSVDRLASITSVDRLASATSMDGRGTVNSWMEPS